MLLSVARSDKVDVADVTIAPEMAVSADEGPHQLESPRSAQRPKGLVEKPDAAVAHDQDW